MPLNSRNPFSYRAAQDVEKNKQLEELPGNVHVFPGDIASFLWVMVPSCALDGPTPVSQRAFSNYEPPKGKKVKSYAGLLLGLIAAVSSFPDDKRPKFFPLHRKELPFPFKSPEFSRGHYKTTPDLAVSFPGDTSVEFDWQNTACFIQVKGNKADDPFEQSDPPMSLEHGATVLQLAIGAQALMVLHGHCAVFALGIYATTCRIIRFDHACAVASPAFSLKRDPQLLQQFFWRLSHPHGATVAKSIVGCDPTVRRLTLAEQDWLVDSLRAAGHAVPPYPAMCRRVECDGTRPGGTAVFKAYFTVGFIDVNPRLMSEATVVWRAVEDPRGQTASDSPLSPLPEVDGNIVVVVVKDSWRRLFRRPEQEFFHWIERRIPEGERIGLPTCIVGCDLGSVAIHRWVAMYRCKLYDAIEALRGPGPAEDDDESDSDESTLPMTVAATMPPAPLPLQQTCTSHLVRGSEGVRKERSHVRFVTSTVGRPLTEFKDTRQLCQAVRDAIVAHKNLWQKPRILHRDISPGNILLVDADLCQADFVGFLHDFDHSAMAYGGVGRCASFDDGEYGTATGYFMATELLESLDAKHEVDHDLESFFWVLLWIVLRHTKHWYPHPDEDCTTLFGTGPDFDAGYGTEKRSYLLALGTKVTVIRNEPLTQLLHDFRLRCGNSLECRPDHMTHGQVLHIFDRALERDDWPTSGDGPRPFVAPGETRTGGAGEGGARSDFSKKRKHDSVATQADALESALGLIARARPLGVRWRRGRVMGLGGRDEREEWHWFSKV